MIQSKTISVVLTAAAVLSSACAKSGGRTSPIPAGSHQHADSVAYFDVDGTNAAEVYRSMISRAPRSQSAAGRAWGRLQMSFGFRDQYSFVGGECRADITFQSRTLMLLPRWRFVSQADASTQRAWGTFTLAVRTHEGNHRAIFLARIDSMYVAVRTLSAPDCATMRTLVHATMASERLKMDREQDALDNADMMNRDLRWPP
jgi:predicted secreted Zn-dependent protease